MEIHPETAAKYSIEDHSLVKIESQRGSIVVRNRCSEKIRKDTVFVPFHWTGGQNVNRLVSDKLDPDSHMPAFKVTAVKITPVLS